MTGLALMGVGLIGLVVPIIPGIPLLIAGVALVGPDHPVVKRLRDRLHKWRRGQGNPG